MSDSRQTEEKLADLGASVDEFVRCIEVLPAESFLKTIVRWTPRDIVAHLIGWNRYTIEGCQQLGRGEAPFYLLDAGNDFRTVNAASVRTYAATNRAELLAELQASRRELEQYLRALDPPEWDTDRGVRYRGRPVTIRNTIAALGHDYRRHMRRIEAWAHGTGKT